MALYDYVFIGKFELIVNRYLVGRGIHSWPGLNLHMTRSKKKWTLPNLIFDDYCDLKIVVTWILFLLNYNVILEWRFKNVQYEWAAATFYYQIKFYVKI
jgi:hypothetical protein